MHINPCYTHSNSCIYIIKSNSMQVCKNWSLQCIWCLPEPRGDHALSGQGQLWSRVLCKSMPRCAYVHTSQCGFGTIWQNVWFTVCSTNCEFAITDLACKYMCIPSPSPLLPSASPTLSPPLLQQSVNWHKDKLVHSCSWAEQHAE